MVFSRVRKVNDGTVDSYSERSNLGTPKLKMINTGPVGKNDDPLRTKGFTHVCMYP